MKKSRFFQLIKNATIEKDVENAYSQELNTYFPNVSIEHNFACDGLIDTKNEDGKLLKLIIEYKYDEDLSSNIVKAKVLTQVLFYLKKFEENGLILPNVAMVADVNECFVIHTNSLLQYLDEKVNWNIAPSKAASYNPDLVLKISEDSNINPFVFDVNEDFCFKSVIDKIYDLASNIQRYIHINEHNIIKIFDCFTKKVFPKTKLSANDQVSAFIGLITKNPNYYKHPSKKNCLVTPQRETKINEAGFDSFNSYFNREYTAKEKRKFSEISDRLIEDSNRRMKGEFYTPVDFVDYAYNVISKEFGENWRDNYTIWDCACGVKNLTRDYHFNNLYCSTLEQAELNIAANYNKEATSFKFDFLNDSLRKIPESLVNDLKADKPIIFLMNPPYGTASSRSGNTKTGIGNTKINELMKEDKIGACSSNLYAQFIYRVMRIKKNCNLTNCHICMFTPVSYLCSSSYKHFRKAFFKEFSFKSGFLFSANYFSNVSSGWGIAFTVWKYGETTNINDFNLDIVDYIDDSIQVIGHKTLYNIDNQKSANDWMKEPIKKFKSIDVPNFTSGLKVKETSRGRTIKDALGYFASSSNNIEKNVEGVALFSSAYGGQRGGGSVLPENFWRCMTLFAARRIISCNWINGKDEYMIPDVDNHLFEEFKTNSLIYGLFNGKNNCTSLRQITYKDKLWNIKNELFWMSKEEILELAENNEYCYNDAISDKDRYVYNILKEINLSKEAKSVLNKANEIVRHTFKYRQLFNTDNPEYQINNWDCGWYQIKDLAKEYAADEMKEFKILYNKLAENMKPMIYELKFLK